VPNLLEQRSPEEKFNNSFEGSNDNIIPISNEITEDDG